MRDLETLRKEIDKLDEGIAELLLARFALVREIGEVKKKEGLPITNAGREEVVIERARSHAEIPSEKDALEKVYRAIIQAAKDLER